MDTDRNMVTLISWKQHEDVIAPKTSAFQAACLFTGVTFFIVAVILYQLTGLPLP